MPNNLNSTGATFPIQTAPAPGEARTSASVATPLQNSADRTQYLKRRLDFVQTELDGVHRLRRVSNLAALQAASVPGEGTVIEVDGIGIYQFVGASVLAEQHPRIVKPTAITHPAPGRWLVAAVGYGMIDTANGMASVDANGKLRVEQLDGAVNGKLDGASIVRGLIDQVFLNVPTGSFVVAADNTWRDVTGYQVTTSAAILVGDMISFAFDVSVTPGNTNKAELRVRLVKPDTSTVDYATNLIDCYGTSSPTVHMAKHIPASQDGAHTIKVQARGAATNAGTFIVSDFNARVGVHRT